MSPVARPVNSLKNWGQFHGKPQLARHTLVARKKLARCRMLICRHWGLNPRVMSWLYTAVVRPITYGAVLWTKKLEENKVSRVSNVTAVSSGDKNP